MACDCHQFEMDALEEHYEKQLEDLQHRLSRLRAALHDAGVPQKTVARLEAGKP